MVNSGFINQGVESRLKEVRVCSLGHSQATPIECVLDSHVKSDSDKLEKTQKKKPQCGYKE